MTIHRVTILTFVLVVCWHSVAIAQSQLVNSASPNPEITKSIGYAQFLDPVQVQNPTDSNATLIWIAPDGSQVRKGDKVAEFDDSQLKESLAKQNIRLQNAKAELHHVAKLIADMAANNESNLAAAKQELKVAELNQKRVLGKNGKHAIAIRYKVKQLDLTKKRLADWIKMSKSAPVTDVIEKERIQLQILEAKISRENLKSEIELLSGAEKEYLVALHKSAIQVAQSKIEQLSRDFKNQSTDIRSKHKAAEQHVELVYTKVKHIANQIKACQVRADQDGTLVYLNTVGPNHDDMQIEEGALVRSRQTIAQIGDVNRLYLKTWVDEKKVAFLKVGQKVLLQRDDLLTTVALQGKILKIGMRPYPVLSKNFKKRYAVSVSLDPTSGVRQPGKAVEILFRK